MDFIYLIDIKISFGIMTAIICIIIFVLFILNIDLCKVASFEALYFFIQTLFPTLFPFSVLTSILIKTNLSEYIGKIFNRPANYLLKTSGHSVFVIFISALAGFPTGAKLTTLLYNTGEISKSQAEILCSMSNMPSLAFMLFIVGQYSLGSIWYGLSIWFIIFFSTIISGYLLNIKNKNNLYNNIIKLNIQKRSILYHINKSIIDSMFLMINICALIVFFACIIAIINNSNLPLYSKNVITSLLELNNGVSIINSQYCTNNSIKYIIICTVCAWSGLCVHMQIYNVMSENDLSCKKYFLSKFICTLFSFILSTLIVLIKK